MIAGLLCNIIHLNREETVKIVSMMVDKQNINNKSPGDSNCKESACTAGDMGSDLGWDDPLENGVVPTPVFLPGEFHGQRGLVGYSPWDRQESDTSE